MPYLERTHLPTDAPVPKIPVEPIEKEESKPALAPALESDTTPAARRKYFANEAHRKEVVFTPQVRLFPQELESVLMHDCGRT